jgi:hypothetical protein
VTGRAVGFEFHRLALPFHTFRMTTLASISTQVVEPLNGCNRRDICDFQLPISKSKSTSTSCCPSRSVLASELVGEELSEAAGTANGSEDWPNTYFHPADVRT